MSWNDEFSDGMDDWGPDDMEQDSGDFVDEVNADWDDDLGEALEAAT
jgi:hypothetical protein